MTATRKNAFPMDAPAPGTRLPDFFLVGAMKAGTTTLSQWLRRHPDLFLCRPKEPQFFSRAEAARRGWAWYSALFADATPGQLLGEASTCYSRWPHFGDVAGRLALHVPDARLIYLMRHPVERAVSHYRHEMEWRIGLGQEPLSVEAALEEMPEIIDASLYDRQIERFLAHFPAERMLLLLTDELDAEPARTWSRVQRFLGVPEKALPAPASERVNEFGDHLAHRAMEERLAGAHRSRPFQLLRRLAPPALRARLRATLLEPRVAKRIFGRRARGARQAIESLSPVMRARLLERFEDSTRALEDRLGRDLGHWRR